jgi:predicted alpha/beta superfamily hydrolase
MKEIKRYQLRGLPGTVKRASFHGRIVDFWAPHGGSDRVLIAHDGQNIFDRRTSTHLQTWRLGQHCLRVAQEFGERAPLIIAVFHSKSKEDPFGRAKDLAPEEPFKEGIEPLVEPTITLEEIRSNRYLTQIFDEILPMITLETGSSSDPQRTAMIGSSMGALATLYANTLFPDRFATSLAFSTHWTLAGNPLVEWLINHLPEPGERKVWMSRGTKGIDAQYPPFQSYADSLMYQRGWRKPNFDSRIFHRSAHNERSWSSYVDEAVRFWFNGTKLSG